MVDTRVLLVAQRSIGYCFARDSRPKVDPAKELLSEVTKEQEELRRGRRDAVALLDLGFGPRLGPRLGVWFGDRVTEGGVG